MTLRVVFRDPRIGPAFREAMLAKVQRIARASTLAARDAAREIEQQGRLSIAQAGRFGTRWQRGLTVRVTPRNGFHINHTLDVYHTETGARAHEFGATIQGKPLLWVPLSFANVKQRAAEYARTQGGLFRVDRKGGKKPLLLSIRTKEPVYVGLTSVRVRPSWGIRRIANDVMGRFAEYYNRHLKAS